MTRQEENRELLKLFEPLRVADVRDGMDWMGYHFYGTFASGEDFDTTFGLMHCVEKAADIYLRILAAGGAKQTMTTENFVAIAALFGLTLPEKFLKG